MISDPSSVDDLSVDDLYDLSSVHDISDISVHDLSDLYVDISVRRVASCTGGRFDVLSYNSF